MVPRREIQANRAGYHTPDTLGQQDMAEVDYDPHTHGYDPVYGARPLKRVIQKFVQDPLAEKILSAEVPDGSLVKVTAGSDRLVFRTASSLSEAA